jgi:energy-coupling factor transport system substrate-specific component
VAAELVALRRTVGEPSYAEIGRRISERRLELGSTPHAARVARTTVYDAFRAGRARVNVAFVREIVEALGGDVTQVDAWIARSLDGPTPEPDGPVEPPADVPAGRTRRQVVLLVLACVAVNVWGRAVVDFLDLPIYLDMVGTAVAAVALGPWWGALVGCSTNLLGVMSSGPASLGFAVVNVVGALLWGYGVRRLGLGRTLARYLLLNVGVAVACTLVAVPILVLLYEGSTGHGEDTLSDSFLALTDTLVVAVGLSNLFVSVVDKLVSGFVALVVVSSLPGSLRPPGFVRVHG